MEKVAIIDGLRTPYIKAGTDFKDTSAVELGRVALRELVERMELDPSTIDDVIIGNVSQPVDSANPSRVIALRAMIPKEVPAYTVHRNCASGMQAVTSACLQIMAGESEIVIAGGVESMSQIPFYFTQELQEIIAGFQRAKSVSQKINIVRRIRAAHLKPVVGVMLGLTDPVCGKNMGQTAETLAREFGVSREEQDAFSLESHLKATAARERLAQEIVPVFPSPDYKPVDRDNGPREQQTMEALSKLKPVFDRLYGTVTAGNASPLTDGAAMLLVMSERGQRRWGISRSATYGGSPMPGWIRPGWGLARFSQHTRYSRRRN